jgi:hypothetical protein
LRGLIEDNTNNAEINGKKKNVLLQNENAEKANFFSLKNIPHFKQLQISSPKIKGMILLPN